MQKPNKSIQLGELTVCFPAKETELLHAYYRELWEPFRRLDRKVTEPFYWLEMNRVGAPDRLEAVVCRGEEYCGGLHLEAFEHGKYSLFILPHQAWENEAGIRLVLGAVLNALGQKNGLDSLSLSFPHNRENIKDAVLTMGRLLPDRETEYRCTVQIALPVAL